MGRNGNGAAEGNAAGDGPRDPTQQVLVIPGLWCRTWNCAWKEFKREGSLSGSGDALAVPGQSYLKLFTFSKNILLNVL